jgi:AcrR family transcriptional regulator
MGIAERREREKEALRTRIVEAARDIVSERGIDALSMRSIAERIEYSPGTIYLYFRDKNQLVGEVMCAGFERMGEYIAAELEAVGAGADAREQHRALGRAYARFALENTAYFRVMFELPAVPQAQCVANHHIGGEGADGDPHLLEKVIQRAMDEGLYQHGDAKTWALVAWGLIHGLTSLYLSGQLAEAAGSREEFLGLVEKAMDSLGAGMLPRETPSPALP